MNALSKYTIQVDAARRIVSVALIGFWDQLDVQAFAIDQQAAVRSLQCRPGTHLVIADLSDFKLQS